MSPRAFSQASENNKQPILDVLAPLFRQRIHVLEIGSGTGQHAVFFAANLPHLIWQPTDLAANLPAIAEWAKTEGPANLRPALEFDVRDAQLPAGKYDAVFTANTLHIMAWPLVEEMFQRLTVLEAGVLLAIYGPFNYGGNYTSESNRQFDLMLKSEPGRGIRDIEAVEDLAESAGFEFLNDSPMPANNRLLAWKKR